MFCEYMTTCTVCEHMIVVKVLPLLSLGFSCYFGTMGISCVVPLVCENIHGKEMDAPEKLT